MAGLGLTLPTFPTSAAAPPKPDTFDGPVGVHHAFGPVPSTDLNVGFSGGAAAVARVEYSPDESLTQTATAEPLPLPGEELVAYRAALRELTPGETYHVQAFLDGERSPIFEVSTAPADATSFTVTAWGDHGVEDPRNDYKRSSEQAAPNRELAASLDPDVHLGIGDISYADGYPYTWDRYFDAHESFFGNTVQMTVPGNHELESGQGFAQYDGRLNALMPTGGDRFDHRWYEFRYGNTQFVGLNTAFDACPLVNEEGNEYITRDADDTYCPGEFSTAIHARQYRFLERTLAVADADPRVTWIVCYHHSPVWTSGNHPPRRGIRESWGRLYDEYDVDLVLTGHNHSYERPLPIRNESPGAYGTTYVVNGTGGTSHYGFDTEEPPRWTVVRNNEHYGVTALDVTEHRLDVSYITLDGTVLDEFAVLKDEFGRPTQADAGVPLRVTDGSRSQGTDAFTGGQTARIELTVNANTPVSAVRDALPPGWRPIAGDHVASERHEGGGQHVFFEPAPDTFQALTYFAEAPSGPDATGRYEFGPTVARTPSSDWVRVPSTTETAVVAGPSTEVRR